MGLIPLVVAFEVPLILLISNPMPNAQCPMLESCDRSLTGRWRNPQPQFTMLNVSVAWRAVRGRRSRDV
jgi:hypothetical protein